MQEVEEGVAFIPEELPKHMHLEIDWQEEKSFLMLLHFYRDYSFWLALTLFLVRLTNSYSVI